MTQPATAWEPLCLDPEELAEWRAGAIPGCGACTTAFANEMRAIGRCNGIPGEVLAGAVQEDEVEEPTPIGRKVPTEVALPCRTCAHADVCRIKPTLVDLARLAVALPVLDPAIGVELAASVSCGHYVKTKKAPITDEPRAARKLNLSDEERERRRQQAISMSARKREAAQLA